MTFNCSPSVLENGSLHSTYVEYIDGARLCLESEAEKDSPSIQEVKLIFCHFVTKIIKSFACKISNYFVFFNNQLNNFMEY